MARVSDNMLPGNRYRATHQSSIDAILNPMGLTRRVVSAGADFVNVDNWYLRMLASNMCKWDATAAQPKVMSKKTVEELVKTSNTDLVVDPYISIAETPDDLPYIVASALIGSAYHEAWHTKYSHRDTISTAFVSATIVPRIGVVNFGAHEGFLLMLMNLIEDIRIERLGCREFTGAQQRMEDLQDFVLDRESEISKESAPGASSTFIGVFRDMGKGYNTFATQKALERYRQQDEKIFDLVATGSLRKYMEAAIALTAEQSTDCLPLAMDLLEEMQNLAKNDKNVANIMKDQETDTKKYILDGADALSAIFDVPARKKTKFGHQMFKPFSTSKDRLIPITERPGGLDVAKLHADVKGETTFLRTRLRQLFKATELVDTEHGVRKGRHISDRMIAESVHMVRGGMAPTRAFYETSEALDLSMAAVVVIDESSSMQARLKETCKIVLCLTESLDSIGCKTVVAGFMKHDEPSLYEMAEACGGTGQTYHRFHAMIYHLFKSFDEKFNSIKKRFAHLNAASDTPMGDGINFALNTLSTRTEGHRYIFVVTDGQPDDGGPVKNRLQVAKTLGIKVIGIGLGADAEFVEKLFPDHVWAASLPEIPQLLVKKIISITERNELNRGRRIRTDDAVL